MAILASPNVAVTEAVFAVPQRGLAAVWAVESPLVQLAETGVLLAPPGRSIPLSVAGLPKNAVATAATLTLTGAPFGRRGLRDHVDLWGATVSDGGTISISGTNRPARIIDFHGLRAVSRIALGSAAGAQIVQLQAWAGVAFDTAHPIPASPSSGTGTVTFPQIFTQKLLVVLTAAITDGQFIDNCTLDCDSFPLNVRFVLAAGQSGSLPSTVDPLPFATVPSPQAIFWTYNGELSGTVTSIDFSAQLNDFLEQCPPQNGRCHPSLALYSDAPGLIRLAAGAVSLTFNHVTTVAFEQGRLERTVSFSRQGEQQQVPLTIRPQPGEQVRVKQIRLQVSGQLAPDRLVPESSWFAEGDRAAARVSTVFSVAQPFQAPSGQAISLAAVELNVTQVSADAQLVLEVRGDANGAPDRGTPLTSVPLDMTPLQGGTSGWVPISLPSPVALQAGQSAWLVLKAAQGSALWKGDARANPTRPAPLHYSRDGGASWAVHTMTGLYKLKRLPAPGEVLPGLTLRLLGQSATLESAAAPQTVVLAYPDPGAQSGGTAALQLQAEAAGSIQVANVVVDYQPVA